MLSSVTGPPVSELTIRDFCEQIADPDRFSGGGAVAALTSASAAATALLVSRLADRRRGATSEQSPSSSPQLGELVERFFESADRDLQVLADLLAAQRTMRADGLRAPYVAALRAAAEEPLRLASDIALLLEIIRHDLPRANRFTVSDLGAAAALARGAAHAALLTATVNVALLRDEPGVEDQSLELETRVTALGSAIDAVADDIIDFTRARIEGVTSVKQAQR
jgi:formiminotetrahydrofolate cyclodeaminase